MVRIILPVILSLVMAEIPARTTLRGYFLNDATGFLTDSLPALCDFSEVPVTGRQTEWSYIPEKDTTFIESHGYDWHRYERSGDTLYLTHTESSHERSDYRIAVTIKGRPAAVQPFRASGRREKAFVYSDSGQVRQTETPGVTVILAEGDTICDAVCTERAVEYRRIRLTPSVSAADIEERELRWKVPGQDMPVAVIRIRTVESSNGKSSSGSTLTVFPRVLNGGAGVLYAPPLSTTAETGKAAAVSGSGAGETGVNAGKQTEIAMQPGLVTATGRGPVRLIIYDISGRVHVSVTGTGRCAADISALPRGEYAVTAMSDYGTGSTKFIIN